MTLGLRTGLIVMLGLAACLRASAAELPVLVFGGASGFPPMEWRDSDGQARGFNVDLAMEMAAQGGRRVEYRVDDWPAMVRGLNDGSIDALAMYKSPERERQYLFTDAFYYLHHGLYSAVGKPPARTLADLRGVRVAVEEASLAATLLYRQVPDAVALAMPTTEATLLAVAEGRADYAIATTLTAERVIERERLQIAQSSQPFWPVAYAFATPRDRPQTAQWLQDTLSRVNSSGRYQDIYETWKSDLVPSLRQQRALQLMTYGIGALLAALLLAFAWQRSLRHRVAARTAELSVAMREQGRMREQLQVVADRDPETDLSRPARFLQDVDATLAAADPIAGVELPVIKLTELDEVVRAIGYDRARAMVAAFAAGIRRLPHLHAAHLGRGTFALLVHTGESETLIRQMTAMLAEDIDAGMAGIAAGCAQWPDHGKDAATLLRRGETALAVAINEHKPSVRYDPTMEPDPLAMEIRTLFAGEAALRVRPVLQPILRLADERVVSAEILARWEHPERGEISPLVFVPVLERSGLAYRLTAAMIGHAARVARELETRGFDCTVSVNVAAQDLMDGELPDIIRTALHTHGARAGALRLELTETGVAHDPERARDALEKLSALGVSVALDDFGTGYSSLSYLSRFPVGELKIDRSFVTDMLDRLQHRCIVRSTVAMARELGLTVTAEGVEDAATLAHLKADGCTCVQGYHVSRPLEEQAFYAFLDQRGASRAAASERV